MKFKLTQQCTKITTYKNLFNHLSFMDAYMGANQKKRRNLNCICTEGTKENIWTNQRKQYTDYGIVESIKMQCHRV